MKKNNNSERSPELSIVIPIYNNSKSIFELQSRLDRTLKLLEVSYEIIFVEDGSSDNSWQIISNLVENKNTIIGVKLSRNFGQHKAISAGLSYAKGNYICVMDGDLQDLPEEIPLLFNYIKKEKIDIVVGRRVNRKDSFLKKKCSRIFYRIFEYFSELSFDYTVANFGIYSQKVIDNYLLLNTNFRFFPIDIKNLGFKYHSIDIEHGSRNEEKSSYDFYKLLSLSINNIIYFSTKPLKMILGCGFVISLGSFVMGAYFSLKHLLGNIPIAGWTSLIVALFFLSGIIIFSLGVMGLYIQRIFSETQKRSLFIIEEFLS